VPLVLKGDGDVPPVSAIGWAVGEPMDNYGTIIHTTDGGETWVRQGKLIAIPNVNLNSVAAIDARTAWVVGDSVDGYGVILRTTDGGQSWQRQGAFLETPDASLYGIYALNSAVAWAVGDKGVILHTTDGGWTWTRLDRGVPNVPLRGLYTSDAVRIWVAGHNEPGKDYGTIVLSADGGFIWWKLRYTLPRWGEYPLFMIHGVDAETVWAVGAQQVIRAADGGTWIDQTPGGLGPASLNGVFAVDANMLWVVGESGGIFRSDNGGTSWVQQSSGTTLNVMSISALDTQTAWAVTDGGVYLGSVLHTVDGGQTWATQTTPLQTNWRWVSFVR